MILKKIITAIFLLSLLSGCAQNAALLGPAYTLAHSGNIYQAGLTYGSNKLIKEHTGKNPIENLKDISLTEKKELKNIEKNTLESEDFYILVKNKIEKTSSILNLTNQ